MQFINYFFSSIISFSGLIIGLMLVKIAPEEQKPLEKYLIYLRKILLALISVFIIFYYFNDYFNLMTLVAYAIFLFFVELKVKDLLKKSTVIYTILGILFFLSSKNTNLFTIESSLILLYGLPTASLIHNKKERNQYKIIFYNIGFIVISNLLFFL